MRKGIKEPFILLLLVLFSAVPFAGCEKSPTHPPVILISIDTLRPDRLGCYGYKRETSPSIDAFAKDGVLFTRAIAQAPYTLPSHMSILTGLYPPTHFAITIDQKLDESRVTMAEILKKEGYVTASFVDAPFMSEKYGFDQGVDFFDEEGGGIKNINRRVFPWLEANRDESFFLFYHVFDVHGPYAYPAPYESMFKSEERMLGKEDLEFVSRLSYHDYLRPDRVPDLTYLLDAYDGGIRYTSDHLEKFFDKLRELDLYDQSIICFISDHGESLFEHNIYVGHGLFLFDSEVHIPLILKLPGNRFHGSRVRSIVESVDVLPTLLELLELPVPQIVQGRSLLPLIHGSEKAEEAEIAFGISPNLSTHRSFCITVRTGKWKYISPAARSPEDVAEKTLRAKYDKDIQTLRLLLPLGEQLYNLEKDPMELKNVVGDHPELCQSFREKAAAWWRMNEAALKKNPVQNKSIKLDADFLKKLESLGYVAPEEEKKKQKE